MSDPVAAPVPSVPPSQNPDSSLSAEALAFIKGSFEKNLSAAYFGFIEHARSLPIHIGMMQRAFQHFDDGLFCLEKAIRMINALPLSPAAQAEVAVVEKVVEGVEAVVDAVEPAPAPAEGNAAPAA